MKKDEFVTINFEDAKEDIQVRQTYESIMCWAYLRAMRDIAIEANASMSLLVKQRKEFTENVRKCFETFTKLPEDPDIDSILKLMHINGQNMQLMAEGIYRAIYGKDDVLEWDANAAEYLHNCQKDFKGDRIMARYILESLRNMPDDYLEAISI